MKRSRKWIYLSLLALLILFLLPAILQTIENEIVYTAKTGRVVDATTNSPMPNVTVIAAAAYGTTTLLGHSGYHGLYRFITSTDANGEYHVPGMWNHLHPWIIPIPGTKPRFTWAISALKPGYVVDGDEDFSDFSVRPKSAFKSPETTLDLGVARVADLRMKARQLNALEAINYYIKIVNMQAGPNSENEKSPKEAALRKIVYEVFAPQICAMNPTAMINYSAGAFSYDYYEYQQTMHNLEEQDRKAGRASRPGTIYAGNECEALKAAEKGSP